MFGFDSLWVIWTGDDFVGRSFISFYNYSVGGKFYKSLLKTYEKVP